MHIPVLQEVNPVAFTDLEALWKLRREAEGKRATPEPARSFAGARFRGPELAELVESLELGMQRVSRVVMAHLH